MSATMTDERWKEIRDDIAFDERRVTQLDEDAAAWFDHAKVLAAEVIRLRGLCGDVAAVFMSNGVTHHELRPGQSAAVRACATEAGRP